MKRVTINLIDHLDDLYFKLNDEYKGKYIPCIVFRSKLKNILTKYGVSLDPLVLSRWADNINNHTYDMQKSGMSFVKKVIIVEDGIWYEFNMFTRNDLYKVNKKYLRKVYLLDLGYNTLIFKYPEDRDRVYNVLLSSNPVARDDYYINHLGQEIIKSKVMK
jgi:hypothetical protein